MSPAPSINAIQRTAAVPYSAKAPCAAHRRNLPRIRGTLSDRMRTLILALVSMLRALLRSRANLALENLALRQQLTIYQRDQKHPRLRPGDRVFWVLLRRLWSG
jgi:hypothetical protein